MKYLYFLLATLALSWAFPTPEISVEEHQNGDLQLRGVRGGEERPQVKPDEPAPELDPHFVYYYNKEGKIIGQRLIGGS